MQYYARKISLAKWPKPPLSDDFDIHTLQADAIADIRTFNNNLSIWSIPSASDSDINEAVLALATSTSQSSFDKMDVVVFSSKDISARGLQLESVDGKTAVTDLKSTHQNIINLTYDSLTGVMKIISEITVNGRHIRRTKKQIETLIRNNFARIDLAAFSNDEIRNKIEMIAGFPREY